MDTLELATIVMRRGFSFGSIPIRRYSITHHRLIFSFQKYYCDIVWPHGVGFLPRTTRESVEEHLDGLILS